MAMLFANLSVFAQPKRTDWFEDARYGMFIHWGLYSAAEGLWKGEKLRYLNNYAEWIRYRNRIAKEEYGTLAKRFAWDRIDPEQWVLLAKKSGMKYIIITAKHHDGVALWDTKIGEYSLPKLSGTNRDVIREMADACRRHGMKLGFYYSHWIDWAHPYAWDHNQELTRRITDAQFDQYWQQKAIPQLRELLTGYGDVAIMWFDMWIPHERTILRREQLEQAAALIRELQPQCLINSRLGLPTDAQYVDFETLGDNVFGSAYTDHPWETPGTIAHSWGYNGQEKAWKSTGQLFASLIGNVSLNGGFTLNIGPRADGSVPYESVRRLDDIGRWLQKYGEAVYGNTGLALRADQHDWAKGQNTVYLHVFNWPLDNVLRVSGITGKARKIELLTPTGSQPLTYKQKGPLMHIRLPPEQPDPFVSVVRVDYDDITLDPAIVAESTFSGFALTPHNASQAETLNISLYDGKRPVRTPVAKGEKLSWEVYLPIWGTHQLSLSAHNGTGAAIPVTIRFVENELDSVMTADGELVAGNELKAIIAPDGRVVAEPNENNYTDEFVDHPMGRISVERPGRYTFEFEAQGEEPIWFHRIWIKNIMVIEAPAVPINLSDYFGEL